MRILLKLFFCTVLTGFLAVHANAQKNQGKPTTQKFKPPKLHTYLGNYKDTVTVPVIIAEEIIAGKLKIFDDKKTEYSISSYQFMYKKKTVTEDEKTGKTSPASSIVSNMFKTSPLPPLWIEKIRQEVKQGEELIFFDVIAKDAQGRVMYASNLKILVQ